MFPTCRVWHILSRKLKFTKRFLRTPIWVNNRAYPGLAQIIHNVFHGEDQDEALGVDEATGDCIGVPTDSIKKDCSIKAL